MSLNKSRAVTRRSGDVAPNRASKNFLFHCSLPTEGPWSPPEECYRPLPKGAATRPSTVTNQKRKRKPTSTFVSKSVPVTFRSPPHTLMPASMRRSTPSDNVSLVLDRTSHGINLFPGVEEPKGSGRICNCRKK